MRSLDQIVPLRDTLRLMPRETALSYASRLAAYSGCLSTRQFCMDFEIDLDNLMRGDQTALAHLAVLTGADFDELRRWSITHVNTHQKVINHETIGLTRSSRKKWFFCPCCAAEDIRSMPDLPADLAVYGRAEWQVSFLRTCTTHHVRLVEFTVKKAWGQKDMGNFISPFLGDLEYLQPEPASPGPAEIYLHARLTGSPHPPVPILDDLDFWEAHSLCTALGASLNGELASFDDLTLNTLERYETAGFEAIKGGASTLRSALRDMRAQFWNGNAVNGCLQRTGRALRNFSSGKPASAAARLIAEAAFATFPFAVGEKLFDVACERSVVIRSGGAREKLGISVTIWNAIVASNPSFVIYNGNNPHRVLIDLDEAASFFNGYVPFTSLRRAKAELGLTSSQVERFVAAGLIKRVDFPALRGLSPVYSLPAIEKAIGELKPLAHSEVAASQSVPKGFVSLRNLSKQCGVEISTALKLIADCRIQSVRCPSSGNINDQIWVDPMDALAKATGIEAPMTLQQVSDAVRIPQNTVRELAHDGILPATRRPWRGGVKFIFDRADIDRFRREFVTSTELAEHSIYMRPLFGRTKAVDVEPAMQLRTINLYRRADFPLAA